MKNIADYPVVVEQNVAWGDMDAFGHVNNVQYYRYIESARIEYLFKLDLFSQNIVTVVASNQCQYLRPVVYPDVLKIGVSIVELRSRGFRMEYLLWSESQQQVVAISEAVMVCLDQTSNQKTNIPDDIRAKIISFERAVGNELS